MNVYRIPEQARRQSFTPVPASGKTLSSLPDDVTFAGYFVDYVRASATIRKVDPHHQNEALP